MHKALISVLDHAQFAEPALPKAFDEQNVARVDGSGLHEYHFVKLDAESLP